MTLTNLTVKDLGDIVEASFQSEGCKVVVQIPLQSVVTHAKTMPNPTSSTMLAMDALTWITSSYLKQNLK